MIMFCWFFKKAIDYRLDERRPLPDLIVRHLRRCAPCRCRYETESRIAKQLAADAGGLRQGAPPFLHARIMARLNRHPAPGSERTRTILSAPAVAAVAVAAVLAGFIWTQHVASQNRLITQQSVERTAAELSALVQAPDEVKLEQWSRKLDQPLETELQLVVSDARTAISYLADNFLPEKFRDSGAGVGP